MSPVECAVVMHLECLQWTACQSGFPCSGAGVLHKKYVPDLHQSRGL